MKKKPRNKRNRRYAIALVALGIIAVSITVPIALNHRQPAPPLLSASAYALVDLDSGVALYEHEPGLMVKLGSLTKLMPVYICMQELEKGNVSLDDVVTISAAAANKSGSVVGLSDGAEVTLDTLLYCTLLPSGNDAVTAISEYICGDESAMVERMNRTAADLGMADTRYTDCAGINSFDNRSTTHDLALLVMEILRSYPRITEYTSTSEADVYYTVDGNTIEVKLKSTNKMFGAMPGIYGLKTGTAVSSHNAVVLMEQNGKNLMAIVLDAPDDITRWNSIKTLLDYGLKIR